MLAIIRIVFAFAIHAGAAFAAVGEIVAVRCSAFERGNVKNFARVEFGFRRAGFDDAVNEIFSLVLANRFADVRICAAMFVETLFQRPRRLPDVFFAGFFAPDEANNAVIFHDDPAFR